MGNETLPPIPNNDRKRWAALAKMAIADWIEKKQPYVTAADGSRVRVSTLEDFWLAILRPAMGPKTTEQTAINRGKDFHNRRVTDAERAALEAAYPGLDERVRAGMVDPEVKRLRDENERLRLLLEQKEELVELYKRITQKENDRAKKKNEN